VSSPCRAEEKQTELGQKVDVGGLVDDLIVADVAVTFAGQIEDVGVVVEEGHQDTRGSVDVFGFESSGHVARIPNRVLALRGFGEAHGEELVVATEIHASHALDSGVSLGLVDDLAGARVDDADLLVLGGSGVLLAPVVPSRRLDDFGKSDNFAFATTSLNVPDLHSRIVTACRQDVVGHWVEVERADLPLVA